MYAIEIDRLSRTFEHSGQRTEALREVSFAVGRGEVVGLLGANGAGKTTLTKIVGTLLLPSAGTARVLGLDVVREARSVREHIAAVFGGERGLYPRLTGRQNLTFFGMLRGLSARQVRARAGEALEAAGLGANADRRVETYSKGMRQRLHVAIGLIATPQVLLLDEPTIGLDPSEAARLRGVIADLREGGVAVLLTSHYLLDIERLADRVVLLHEGRVTDDLTLAEFTRRASHVATVVVTGSGRPPRVAAGETRSGALVVGLEVARRASGAVAEPGAGWRLELRLPAWDTDALAAAGRICEGCTVEDVALQPVRMEDIYTEITGAGT